MLTSLTDMLSHRGPDGSGTWLRNADHDQIVVALGHRRLSIIDIDGGTQPMAGDSGDIVLVFNGEIYNYLELREELLANGHGPFHTNSDTEVLIKAYEAWGVGCLDRLRGMYAFALWDGSRQTLILVRDPFGKKPLFLRRQGDALAFSSEIAPLLKMPGALPRLRSESVEQYLINRFVPSPWTFFEGIEKVPPGTSVTWQRGMLSVRRFFTPPILNTEPDITGFEQAERLFESCFDDAVRLRMRSDAPFGAFLSGGLDSASVVALMCRHATTPVKTFSVGFPDDLDSELQVATESARFFGVEHTSLALDARRFLDAWPSAVRHRAAPVSEASDIPIFLLAELASRSVKMVLTGEGADEFFGGYPKHRAAALSHAYRRAMPAGLHNMLISPIVEKLPFSMQRQKLLLRALGLRDDRDFLRVWFGSFTPNETADLLNRPPSGRVPDDFPFDSAGKSILRRLLHFDQSSWLPDNLLERGDRMLMAHSVEGRMPFMDIELARLAARLPDQFLVGGRGGKTIVRAAMRQFLPPAVPSRRKVGFKIPLARWFRGELSALTKDLLLSSESRIRSLCDQREIGNFLESHLSGRSNNEKALWTLANLELFLREYRL